MTRGRDASRWIESFWRGDADANLLTRAVLTAASALYRAGRAIDRGAHGCGIVRRRRLPVPVASVGNLTVGGTGKTPFVAWLARALLARGRRVMILGRGYRREPGARLNDEGEWLAAAAPGAVIAQDPDRGAAALAALVRQPIDLALLDDGFQHEALERDVDVVLIDATNPFGNGRLLPRGPLRESISSLARAHFVFATRAELADERAIAALRNDVGRLAPAARFGVVRFAIQRLRRGGAELPASSMAKRAVVLLTGVGHPAAVVATLERLGARVQDTFVHADHHAFAAADLERAVARAAALGAELVTTAKDAVKLDRLVAGGGSGVASFTVVEQEVLVDDVASELVARLDALATRPGLSSSASGR